MMEQKRNDKNNMMVKNSKKQQQKKEKSSLMKKLLNTNKIVSILSHQPKKLMKLAKKGNLVYKNLEQHSLLPKLTLKNLFPEIQNLNQTNQKHHEEFQVVNKQLTCSMINFQHKFTEISQQDQGKILNLQTQKCYSHIPSFFFKQLTQQKIHSILTKNKSQAKQKAFDYVDYSDEVQYNINQQVGYKMKVFMQFAFFLQGIAGLVDISCKKIQGSRTRNNILKEIIVQKSTNINILRAKQHNLGECIKIVNQLKKVKNMQKSVMSLIHAKGKIGVNQFYQQYCKQHLKIRQFCCKKGLCSFGDIKYYVERNYQDTFNKSLQNYLTQMTKIDKKKLYQILKPNKNVYVSMNFQNKTSLVDKSKQKNSFNLDQSMQIQDEFELIVKSNIQRQIASIFEMGMMKCTYCTDNLCLYLKDQFQELEINVYSTILTNLQKPKEDLLDNFVNYALNKPSQGSLQLNIDDKLLSFVQKSQIVNKISMVKFYQIAQLSSKQLMSLCRRCFSVINQLMAILKQIQIKQPQKQQIISAYLIQLVLICINSSDLFLGTFINLRQVKQSQIQICDKVIDICQQWQQFLDEMQTKHQSLWRKLVFHLSDKPYNNIAKSKKPSNQQNQIHGSFKGLQQFVKNNYSTKQIQQLNQFQNQNQDVSEQLLSKQEMKLKLIPQIIYSKNTKISFNFYSLGKFVISKEISKKIENQTWGTVSMNSTIQNSVGFILYGEIFIHRLESQNDSRNYLSKSLLLDKSNLGYKKKSQQFIPPPPQQKFPIQTTQKLLKLGQKSYKLIGVSQYVLQIIYLFFVYLDKYEFLEQAGNMMVFQKENIPEKSFEPERIRFGLVLEKAIQLILIFNGKIKYYVNNLKDLQKKVKSFAKFLLLAYVQLDFFKTIILSVINDQIQKKRFQNIICTKHEQKQIAQLKKNFTKQIDECMTEITKKYNSIGYQKIKQSIKKMEINPKKQIKVPSQTTSQILTYFSKSLEIIEDVIIDKTQFWKFLNCNWIKLYLERVNEQYSIVRKYVLKSNGSGNGRKMQQIQWQDKLDWKVKQLKWLISAMQNQNYTQHIKDIGLIQQEIKKNK